MVCEPEKLRVAGEGKAPGAADPACCVSVDVSRAISFKICLGSRQERLDGCEFDAECVDRLPDVGIAHDLEV